MFGYTLVKTSELTRLRGARATFDRLMDDATKELRERRERAIRAEARADAAEGELARRKAHAIGNLRQNRFRKPEIERVPPIY